MYPFPRTLPLRNLRDDLTKPLAISSSISYTALGLGIIDFPFGHALLIRSTEDISTQQSITIVMKYIPPQVFTIIVAIVASEVK